MKPKPVSEPVCSAPTIRSGFVFFARMRRIISERRSGETLSALELLRFVDPLPTWEKHCTVYCGSWSPTVIVFPRA